MAKFKVDTDKIEEINKSAALLRVLDERQKAYQKESDPLYFGIARGENTQEDWLGKIAEIKERYPKP